MNPQPRVLFVCIENSFRSQIAEAFARTQSGGRIAAFSAGSRPAGKIQPVVVRLMKEIGVDVAGQTSKGLDALPSDAIWDWIVTMGCGDACPHLPARNRIAWDLPDPRDMDDEGVRRIRDRIELEVARLIDIVTERSSASDAQP